MAERGEAVALHEVEQALRADVARRDLRIHVANHQLRHADVVGDHPPERLVALAALVHLQRPESQSLRVGVRADHDADAARLA